MEIYKNSLITPNQLYPLIGRNIRQLRRQRNMTQEQLAELIDGDQKAISKIESGKARPGLSTYLRIANVFQVSIDAFLINITEMNGPEIGTEDLDLQPFGIAEKKLTKEVLNAVLVYLQTKE